MKKPIRTLSGVSPVSVMTDLPCPGNCIFCPGESAKSYFDDAPVPARAKAMGFDPFRQVTRRIRQYQNNGHPASKIELIIMGGTFPAQGWEYQSSFVKACLEAMNKKGAASLEQAQSENETAEHRCTGMTVETRPDYCQVEPLLKLGVTRVELGVQIPDDRIYQLVNRMHKVQDVVDATGNCRKAGLKVCYHMMPGLPGSNPKKDLAAFKKIFDDDRFKPDMIKIYPCLVTPKTKLWEMWKKGEYEPYTLEQCMELMVRIKKLVPPWVRIMRVHRDFPKHHISAGITSGHLRELVWKKMREEGKECGCIRCREVKDREGDPRLEVVKYKAGGGEEWFISFEEPLVGFIRLRLDEHATVRELHVYGPEVPVGEENAGGRRWSALGGGAPRGGQRGAWQHRGFGKKLLAEAEEVAENGGFGELRVLSGVGAREYYRKLGYELNGYYMVKQLKNTPSGQV